MIRPFVKFFSVLSVASLFLPGSADAFQANPADDEDAPRAYADVITADAVTDGGLFDVHRVGENRFFEFRGSLLGRDMLLVSRIGKVPVGFPGFQPAGVKTGEQVLRWERRGDRILLRTISYANVADLRSADDVGDLQVAVGGSRGPHAIRLVGQFEVMGAAIGFAVDRHGPHA